MAYESWLYTTQYNATAQDTECQPLSGALGSSNLGVGFALADFICFPKHCRSGACISPTSSCRTVSHKQCITDTAGFKRVFWTFNHGQGGRISWIPSLHCSLATCICRQRQSGDTRVIAVWRHGGIHPGCSCGTRLGLRRKGGHS